MTNTFPYLIESWKKKKNRKLRIPRVKTHLHPLVLFRVHKGISNQWTFKKQRLQDFWKFLHGVEKYEIISTSLYEGSAVNAKKNEAITENHMMISMKDDHGLTTH